MERITQVSIKMILGTIGVFGSIACFFLLLLGHQIATDQAYEQRRQGRGQRKTKSGDGEQKSHMKIENPVERMTQVSIKMILGIIGLVFD